MWHPHAHTIADIARVGNEVNIFLHVIIILTVMAVRCSCRSRYAHGLDGPVELAHRSAQVQAQLKSRFA